MASALNPEYRDFFIEHPERYRTFSEVADNAGHFYEILKEKKFFSATSLLSIGSGEAKLEHRFASEHQIPVGLIEPNPHFHAAAVMQFQQTNQAKFLREAHPYPFENVSLNYRYPLILAIHSWYSFGTDQKILEKAFDRLVPGGHLWIALVAPNNMIYEIGEATQNFTAKSLHSQGLSEWAVQAGFPHEYITTQKKIPHAQLFDASGNWTPAGERFAAFSTFKAWSEIEQSDREMIRTIIEAHATHDGEYFLLHHGSLVFKKDS